MRQVFPWNLWKIISQHIQNVWKQQQKVKKFFGQGSTGLCWSLKTRITNPKVAHLFLTLEEQDNEQKHIQTLQNLFVSVNFHKLQRCTLSMWLFNHIGWWILHVEIFFFPKLQSDVMCFFLITWTPYLGYQWIVLNESLLLVSLNLQVFRSKYFLQPFRKFLPAISCHFVSTSREAGCRLYCLYNVLWRQEYSGVWRWSYLSYSAICIFYFFLLVCFLLESLKGRRVSLSLILDVIGKSPNLTTDNQVIAKSCVILDSCNIGSHS